MTKIIINKLNKCLFWELEAGNREHPELFPGEISAKLNTLCADEA